MLKAICGKYAADQRGDQIILVQAILWLKMML